MKQLLQKLFLLRFLNVVKFGIVCMTAFLFMGTCGCMTTQTVNDSKPADNVFIVHADKLWQDSGVYVRRGQLIQCSAYGKWRDRDRTYGPEGNDTLSKDHLGVSAPANSLLMRLSSQTNLVWYVASHTNVIAERSGNILFRNNVSLPIGVSGKLKVIVKVAPDADRDGLSDYEEVHIWNTNPLNPDTDGDGFSDVDEVSDKKSRLRQSSDTPNH